jgi:hypothetical protein
LPQYFAVAKPFTDPITWSSLCFQQNSASVTKDSTGNSVTIQITSSHPNSLTCSDLYALMTTCTFNYFEEVKPTINTKDTPVITTIQIPFPDDITDAERWDIDNTGVRFYHHLHDKKTILSNFLVTIKTFIPEHVTKVPEEVAQMTIDFMSKYVGDKTIKKVDPSTLFIPAESQVKSGDAFYLRRLDGMGALFSWAMGANTGHVATALWVDGELCVVESTMAGAAWPTDYVQRTPYQKWINQTIEADWSVVWAPLNDEVRKGFNETAAVEWFKSVEGFNYGFQNVIWGWLDTANDNFPCLPPDFSSNCWHWEFLETLIAYVDHNVPEIGDNIWNAGWNKRLGTTGLRTAELLQETLERGMTPRDIIQIVEDDTWVYNTTRNGIPTEGPALVCCVFVCDIWKYGGVFGEEMGKEINCAEVTNWDDVRTYLFFYFIFFSFNVLFCSCSMC